VLYRPQPGVLKACPSPESLKSKERAQFSKRISNVHHYLKVKIIYIAESTIFLKDTLEEILHDPRGVCSRTGEQEQSWMQATGMVV